MTHKVNVYFGYDVMDVGGQYGEIDNFSEGDDEKWAVHVRPIVSTPELEPHGTVPRPTAETSETFDTLEEAIEAVPAHIATYYE
jgi:hypothetical protein